MFALQHILEFGGFVYSDKENIDDAVSKAVVALLGDIASTINGVGPVFQQQPYIQSLIMEARSSQDPGLAENAKWAAAAIQKSMAAAPS